MKMPYNPGFKGEKIPSSELIQMGIRIKQFVDSYRKYVLINTPNKKCDDPIQILNTLDMISHKMITQQYQDLFDDITVIDQTNESCPF